MAARFPSFRLWPGAPRGWCRSALSRGVGLQDTVDGVVRQLRRCGPADLALVFVSTGYASDLPRLLPLLQRRLKATHWLGCAAGGVVGTDAAGGAHELEHEPALAVTLLGLPGARLHPFALPPAPLPDLDGPAQPWIDLVGTGPEGMEAMLLLCDPECPQLNDLISGLDFAFTGLPKLGGVAGAHSARHGSLLLGDQVVSGAVGCLIGGAWRIEPVVAQGCRPIGPVFEVEQAERNVMLQLSSAGASGSPVACLQTVLQELTPQERELARHSLFLGVGRSSFEDSPGGGERDGDGGGEGVGAGAFLVRQLIGVDPRNGAVAVAERLRVGQQVQFQLRDADASRQEQRQLFAAARRPDLEPLLALLFACLGRGTELYGHADGDVNLCREQFPAVPITGAFCNGEIGPMAGTTHLHGFTASWGFLVPSSTT